MATAVTGMTAAMRAITSSARLASRARRASRGRPSTPGWRASQVLSLIACAFAAMDVVGGYVVTDRMLQMFKRKPVAKPETERDEVAA